MPRTWFIHGKHQNKHHIYVRTHVRTYRTTYVHTHMYVCAVLRMYTHVRMYRTTYTYTCTTIYTYVHTAYTHTPVCSIDIHKNNLVHSTLHIRYFHTYVHTYILLHTYITMYIRIYYYVCTHICTYSLNTCRQVQPYVHTRLTYVNHHCLELILAEPKGVFR